MESLEVLWFYYSVGAIAIVIISMAVAYVDLKTGDR